jgi:exonuclease SbcC
MRITRIIFKNFMGYKQLAIPEGNDDLPKGLILISGKNSYGKSTILEGVLFAFFGPKIFKGRNAESFITYGVQEKAEIYLYFSLDKERYYIYRKWRRGSSVSLKMFKMNNSNQYREVKDFNIDDFFEISPEQALSTVFVRQGEVEELANKKGAELREMIIDLFRLNIIDDALNVLDSEIKTKRFNKEQLEKSRVPIERIEEDIERALDEISQFKKLISANTKKKNEIEEKLKLFPSDDLVLQLEGLYQQIENSKDKVSSLKADFSKKLSKSNLKLEDFEKTDNVVKIINTFTLEKNNLSIKKELLDKKRIATSRGLGKTKGRIEDIQSKISKMKESFQFSTNEAKKEGVKCPTCQSVLTKEHYEKMIQQFNQDLIINQEKIKSISSLLENSDAELDVFQTQIDKCNERLFQIESLKSDYDNILKYQKDSVQIQTELDTTLKIVKSKIEDPSPDGIKKLLIEKEKFGTELISIKRDLEEKKEYIESNQKRIENLQKEIERMKELERKIGDLEIDVDHLNKAKEFVRRFVTEYMVVKRLVKNIALITNTYIKDFTSGQYSDLLLDLSGSRKTGLSLKIRDNFNNVHESIEVLSGGDKTALGMALRLSISELMSKIRPTKDSPKKNPKIDFLLLDEPLAALDETRRERILKHLIKSQTFSQIFLITHTTIPTDIKTHKVIVDKDHATGISTAKFEKLKITPLI